MPDIVIVFIGMAIGLFLGAQIALLVMELTHDCLPHDPRRCKESGHRPVDTEATP